MHIFNGKLTTGDKVQHLSGGPIMEVVGQEMLSDQVECAYYCYVERDWKVEYHSKKDLIKVDGMFPLWVMLRTLMPQRTSGLAFN